MGLATTEAAEAHRLRRLRLVTAGAAAADVVVGVRPGENLEAALKRYGYTRPRGGCRRGGCGQCRVTVTAGTVHDERPVPESVISATERAAGAILLCRAQPDSDVTVLVTEGQVRCVSPMMRDLAARELAAPPAQRPPHHQGG